MRLSAKAPIVIRGEEITHLDADGYKHLPRATALPDGKVLATSGGKWGASDLSGVSVASVFGRTGAVVAQTGDYTPAQVGAEPYAGTPAQTSFWRSTAAGVRAWVQLVAADITDLATTLAGYLTKLNPTYNGRLTGPTQYLEADEQVHLAIRRPGGNSGRIHGIAFQAQDSASAWVEFGRIMTYISSVTAGVHTGGMRLMAYKAGAIVQALEAGPDGVRVGANLPLQMGTTTVVDSSRNITGATVKGLNAAGIGIRPAVALADGTFDDQDAATFRGTIGALPTDSPDFSGALKQGGVTRIASGGGAWFASMQSANLVGAGDRPVATDLTGTLQPKTPDQFRSMISALAASLKGAANGVAELGADGRVPSGQLPSYVDDVLEYANFAAFPATGETGKIYVTQDNNKTWRWSGSAYAEISASLALGETSSTAYRGDRGKTAYDHSQVATGNPHGTTAADVEAMAAANPVFTGALKQGGTTRITSDGGADVASLRVSNLSSAFNGVLTSDYVGGVGVRGAVDFRDNYIQAAASDHNHDGTYLPVAAPKFTGELQQAGVPRITAGGDGRFTSLRASGLAASNTYIPRLDANGELVASPVKVTPGVGVVFEQAASLQAAGGAWGGSSYTTWTPSAIVPLADDAAGNSMPSLGTGYLWNSQRLNALTITDGAAASPYRGRVRADRWVATSLVSITGTTSATSWFAAGTGEGSPSLPANYLKGGRRVRAKGRASCQSCAADSAPEFAFKIGSTTIKTQAKAFTIASGNAIYIDFDVDFFADGDGFLIAVGDIKFYSPAVSSYEYKISYVGAYDGSTAKTIDATIKPSSSGETWSRNLAFVEA